MNKGKVLQVNGAVVDVIFEGELPKIYTALKIEREGQGDLILEIQQHLGENKVRTVAMDATEGMVRGMEVVDTGQPITMPVGPQTLGRLINVIGDPIDELGEIETALYGHPDIKEVAAVAIPDELIGNRIKAFVIFHDKKN